MDPRTQILKSLISITIQKTKTIGRLFWRKWPKTLFSAFYNIFTGMPKACQIIQHKPLTSNYKVHWSPSPCKNLKQSDDIFWGKWPITSFSAFYEIFAGMPKACQIFPAQTTYAKSLSSLASIIVQKN